MAYESSILVFTSFFLCLMAVPGLRVLATNMDLTDKPMGRKTHRGEVPLVGGIAIFLSGALAVVMFYQAPLLVLFVLLSIPLILVGVLDDLYGVHPSVRILAQIVVSVGVIYLADLRIEQIGDIFGRGEIVLGPLASPLFTTFCVVGVINAINMLDGSDGLAGSITLITVAGLGAVAAINGDSTSLAMSAMLGGGILAFLLYNAHIFGTNFRIFLGDAGSMFLGFALIWLFITLSQTEGAVSLSPVAAGWILGVPLIDVVSLMVSRIRNGKSPFTAGRDHFHHLLLDSGYPTKTTVFILAAFQAVLVGCGLLLNQFDHLEPFAFWLFVLVVITHHFFTPSLIGSNRKPQTTL